MPLLISLKAETIFSVLGFPVTNTLIMAWLAVALLFLFFYRGTRNLRAIPAGLQSIVEVIYEEALAFMDLITGTRERSERFLPFCFTLFLLVLASNWLGIIPGAGSIGLREADGAFIPFARSANSDLNMTLALAIISIVGTHVLASRMIGFGKHAKTYFNTSGPIQFFVGLLELLGEFSKMLSFSFRLFGNIFAGEVLLMVIGGLLPFIAPIPFLGLEIFVGLVQALIFASLTLVFLNMAASEH